MLNLIVAPRTHNPKAERTAKRVVKYLKSQQLEYAVYFSESMESVGENIKNLIAFGENELIIIGDDALIHNVLINIKDLSKIKCGIVPTGKNEDFARCLEISSNPIQATKNILQKHIEKIDLLVVNDMPVINNVCIGASVDVFHKYSQYKIKNFVSKKIAISKYGNNFAGIELTISSKNKTKKELIFDLVIANGGLSKGVPVSPLSNIQDGLFNLIYSNVQSKDYKKKYIKLLNSGEHIHDVETKQYWMNSLKITNSENKIKVLIDGEIQNLESLNISIIEKGLNIYK